MDDIPQNLALLSSALEPEGYEILAAPDGETARKVAARARPDLILMDVMMPEISGFETCRRLKANPETREIPVIFLTARSEMESVVEGFRAGGVDYITKPFQLEEVLGRVATHLRVGRLTRELRTKNEALELRAAELEAEIGRRRVVETALQKADETLTTLSDIEASRWNLGGLIGGSPLIRKVVEDINRLHAFTQTSVLITGESGTGKELVARAIHFNGGRAKSPFVPVNCVAIPAELAESMLFGHVRGAFTGALSDRKGCFEMAHGGTLFLDEIGDMPPPLQVKLLRVLEDGCITPVGSSHSKKVDVRIVAATNANLDARIANGAFRQDLYFRLARYVVHTPPLRERPLDVLPLAEHFLNLFAKEMGLRPPPLSDAAREILKAYTFPGNVRELKNIMERALIESAGSPIERSHLHLLNRQSTASTVVERKAKADSTQWLPLNLAEAEEKLIQRALQETGGNIADAARLLGVHRTRIYRLLAKDDGSSAERAQV